MSEVRLGCEDEAPSALNVWLAGVFPKGTAGGFLRFAGGGGAGRLCGFEFIVDEEEDESTETGESGGSSGERGEGGSVRRSAINIDACVAGADVGEPSLRSRVVSVENAAVVASVSIDPARCRTFPGPAVAAVTIRGRLVVLSALGCRRPSKYPCPPCAPRGVFCSEDRRDIPMSSRFSALRLAPLFFPRIEFDRSCRDDASASMLCGIDTADVTESAGLVTRPGVSPFFRNCTHQSPDRHRCTSRFVVGSTSRIFSFSMSDSSVRTICGRLYGMLRNWVLVRRGWRTRRYVCLNCNVSTVFRIIFRVVQGLKRK